MNINIMRPGQSLQECFLPAGIDRREVEDAGETISNSMWKNVLVKGLTSEYDNINLTASPTLPAAITAVRRGTSNMTIKKTQQGARHQQPAQRQKKQLRRREATPPMAKRAEQARNGVRCTKKILSTMTPTSTRRGHCVPRRARSTSPPPQRRHHDLPGDSVYDSSQRPTHERAQQRPG